MDRSLGVLAAILLTAPAASVAEDPSPAAAKAPAPAVADPATIAETMVGEVITLPFNRSASYGPTVVRGPGVNLTDKGPGSGRATSRT